MRFVIQRVTESNVKVDGKVIGQIGKGFMVLIGVADSDTKEIADKMVKKMTGLRIFEDEEGKTNLSLDAVGGELLLISQFTYMRTAKRETGQVLSKQGNRTWQKNFTNILSVSAKNRYR